MTHFDFVSMGEIFNPSWILAEAGEGAEVSSIGLFLYIALVVAIVFVILSSAKKGLNEKVFKNPLTQKAEQLYLFIQNMALGIIGPHGRKYVPMMFTFWLVIFISNVVGLFMPMTPTASLSFNLGMALISIGYVQFEGMKANGVFGHLSHFAGPRLPIAMAIVISPVIFCIEVVSELMKNVSLSLRLFGNIHGGHEAVMAMNNLGHHIGGMPWLNFPFGALLLPIKLLTCVVQALIFSLLTCVYISLVTGHHEEHGEHEGEHGAAAPAH